MQKYKELLSSIKTFIFDIDGVLTDGKVLINKDGDLLRMSDVKDGFAIKYALTNNYKIAIISGGKNDGVRKRYKELGIIDIYLGVDNKLEAYNDLVNKYSLDSKNILYMGDDIPDIPVMKKVGISCCPADAVSDVKKVANIVSNKNGGEGCVRKIIEEILRLQGNWTVDVN